MLFNGKKYNVYSIIPSFPAVVLKLGIRPLIVCIVTEFLTESKAV